ncbi:hypothetical protein HELRODRAFT_92351, partial [Helobdella robusta]|uniref:LRRNT domain-containing protein n=1 Tax=Helobdella robusta TaxID=6412 RepID=T1G8E7_HELRO
CPSPCFCNHPSRIVYCSKKNLTRIPNSIPGNTLQLILNFNQFQSSRISVQNFSNFSSLEHLYLSKCGIEYIEVDTFIVVKKLQWLDLSNNKIRYLKGSAFNGLSLKHLFLNGN